jgi:hypothetical protein
VIEYKKRCHYKYTLFSDYQHQTDLRPATPINTPYISLSSSGLLVIVKDYSWDGPSGPTIDTANFMRGSLVHDALYQLMRENYIEQAHRKYADVLLREICIQSGMSKLSAWLVFNGVRLFGASSAKPDLLTAP